MLRAFKPKKNRVGSVWACFLPAAGFSSQPGASFYFFGLLSAAVGAQEMKIYSETLHMSKTDNLRQGQQLVYLFYVILQYKQ